MAECRPWWAAQFVPLSTGYQRPKIRSGCSIVGGNVNCSPEKLRADAEAQMNRLGYWSGYLPLATYALARYASSEVGGGTPEEKAAVMELAINRARGTSTARGYYPNDSAERGVVRLLLYRQYQGHPNYGRFGPIHEGTSSPYGRWASTNQDPGVDDILIADFVLKGKTDNFTREAVTQYGMDVGSIITNPPALVEKVAREGYYWVGPIPGIDHWHTFLLRQDKSLNPNSPRARAMIDAGKLAVTGPVQRPDWSQWPFCSRPIWKPIAIAGFGVAFAGAVWWTLTRADKLPERYQFPWA